MEIDYLNIAFSNKPGSILLKQKLSKLRHKSQIIIPTIKTPPQVIDESRKELHRINKVMEESDEDIEKRVVDRIIKLRKKKPFELTQSERDYIYCKPKKRRKLSKETCMKISIANMGKKKPLRGPMPYDVRVKISNSKCGTKRDPSTLKYGLDNPSYGTHRTDASRELMGLRRVERNVGGFWIGNIVYQSDKLTTFVKYIRTLQEYKLWVGVILERDKLIDRITNKICDKPEVHHIIPISSIIRKYKLKTVGDALNCDELWDFNNGICVNHDTHIAIHGYEYKNGKSIPCEKIKFKF